MQQLDYQRIYSVVKAVLINRYGFEKAQAILKPVKEEIVAALASQGNGIFTNEVKDEFSTGV